MTSRSNSDEEIENENLTALARVSTPTTNLLAEIFNNNIVSKKFTCLGYTKDGRRCSYEIAKDNCKKARNALKRLEKSHKELASQNQSGQLEALAKLLLCKRYHQNQAAPVTRTWQAAFIYTTERRSASDSATTCTRPITTRVDVAATQDGLQLSLVSANITPWFFAVNGWQTRIRTLVPFDAEAKHSRCTERYVKNAIKENLGKKEIEEEGTVYIYWCPGNFGLVKIGVTNKRPEVRLQEWQRQCGHETQLAYPISKEDREPVPHVYRVEKIVHAQLRNLRRKETECRKCCKCHREWFEAFVNEATAAVKRWSAWMREHPYEQTLDGVWRLKEHHNANMQTLCRSESGDRRVSAPMQSLKERSSRLSVSPRSHRRTKSEEPRRRSLGIAEKQQSTLEEGHTENEQVLCHGAPEDQKVEVSTSQLEQRGRKILVPHPPSLHAKSEGLRRSSRIADKRCNSVNRNQDESNRTLCRNAPEDRNLEISASPPQEKSRPSSVPPHPSPRGTSEQPHRRSPRLAEKQRSTSAARRRASDTSITPEAKNELSSLTPKPCRTNHGS
ncbi:MAG: hypothetical protein Q9201_007968 [Fulgogasparrea decipioides]